MHLLSEAGRFTAPAPGEPRHWVEHLRSADLSVGTYSVPADGADLQQPHSEDEIYVVLSGRAVLEADSGRVPVSAGSVLFVPAGERHRFVEQTEPLAVLVVFAPAEGSRAEPATSG
ncbi:MAG TPA: cupin domain-containing protein [Jatrophihabitans sp.]|nr:cupin domain-containing protein [Jatrophihabitans sp.]